MKSSKKSKDNAAPIDLVAPKETPEYITRLINSIMSETPEPERQKVRIILKDAVEGKLQKDIAVDEGLVHGTIRNMFSSHPFIEKKFEVVMRVANAIVNDAEKKIIAHMERVSDQLSKISAHNIIKITRHSLDQSLSQGQAIPYSDLPQEQAIFYSDLSHHKLLPPKGRVIAYDEVEGATIDYLVCFDCIYPGLENMSDFMFSQIMGRIEARVLAILHYRVETDTIFNINVFSLGQYFVNIKKARGLNEHTLPIVKHFEMNLREFNRNLLEDAMKSLADAKSLDGNTTKHHLLSLHALYDMNLPGPRFGR